MFKFILVSLFLIILFILYYRFTTNFECDTNVMWFGDKGLGLTVTS